MPTTAYFLIQNAAYKARLEELKSGTAPIPVEQRKKIDTEYDRMCKEWRMRRKLVRSIHRASAWKIFLNRGK